MPVKVILARISLAEMALPTPPQMPEVVAMIEFVGSWGACIVGEIVMQG